MTDEFCSECGAELEEDDDGIVWCPVCGDSDCDDFDEESDDAVVRDPEED